MYGGKRCMLTFSKPDADFSRGRADRGISQLLFTTYPPPQFANGSMSAPCTGNLAPGCFIHCCYILSRH